MPVPILARRLRHMRRWDEADWRDGYDRAIHPLGQSDLRNGPVEGFRSIRRDAGLGREIKMRRVCMALGVVLMLRLRVYVYAGFLMMGMDPVDCDKRCRRHHPDYRKAFKRALIRRIRSVGGASPASL